MPSAGIVAAHVGNDCRALDQDMLPKQTRVAPQTLLNKHWHSPHELSGAILPRALRQIDYPPDRLPWRITPDQSETLHFEIYHDPSVPSPAHFQLPP